MQRRLDAVPCRRRWRASSTWSATATRTSSKPSPRRRRATPPQSSGRKDNVDTDHNRNDFVVAPPDPRSGGVVQPSPTLSISDASISEGDVTMTFTVSLSRASGTDVSYAIETRNITAIANLDFVPLFLAGQFIPAGQLSATHVVTIHRRRRGRAAERNVRSRRSPAWSTPMPAISSASARSPTTTWRSRRSTSCRATARRLSAVNRDVLTGGIVTARKTNGFFIQTPDGDDDGRPETSEGLFVFTSAVPPQSVAVGDEVRVSGRLVEFRSSSAATPGTLTEITGPAVETLSSGNPLPAAARPRDPAAAARRRRLRQPRGAVRAL